MIFPEEHRIYLDLPKIDGETLHCFSILFKGRDLKVIATKEPDGWERVTVSLNNRTPNWGEMCHIKNLFWGEDEFCIQLHPSKKDYINIHPFCLHIFKPPENIINMIQPIT
jgi:hypothetical protein